MNKRTAVGAILGALALFTGFGAMADGMGWNTAAGGRNEKPSLRWAQQGDFSLVATQLGPWTQGESRAAGVLEMRGIRGYAANSDLYLIGKWSSQFSASVGAVGSWAASDQLEFHGAYGRTHRFGEPPSEAVPQAGAATTGLYTISKDLPATQLLGGVRWTTRRNLSLTAEAWYDGAAPSNGFWESWLGRPDSLRGMLVLPGSAQMSYGISGRSSIGQMIGPAPSSLRRTNLFLRTSWRFDGWEPGVDVLYTPLDGGMITTAKVIWQGERVRFDAGARFFGGRANSLYALVPWERVVYVGAAVHF